MKTPRHIQVALRAGAYRRDRSRPIRARHTLGALVLTEGIAHLASTIEVMQDGEGGLYAVWREMAYPVVSAPPPKPATPQARQHEEQRMMRFEYVIGDGDV